MKLLYILHSLTLTGGLEKITTDKINYFIEKYGYTVFLVTIEQHNRPFPFKFSKSVQHIDLNIPTSNEYSLGIVKRIVYHKRNLHIIEKKILDIVRDSSIDIVIGNTYDFIALETLYKIRHKVTTIIESHSAKKYINEVYALNDNNNIFKRAKITFRNIRIAKIIKSASAFVTLTRSDALEWSETRRITVIPNFIHSIPQRFCNPNNEKKEIIAVGRLSKQKGFDLLIQSWRTVNKRHNDWKLNIYGNGPEKETLITMIKNNKLNNCINLYKPTINIFSEYTKNDIFILSSRWEGFGIVLIEAMSVGLPCIAFNCPYGPSEIISNGRDGIIVKLSDIDELSNNICNLIEDKEKRVILGNN